MHASDCRLSVHVTGLGALLHPKASTLAGMCTELMAAYRGGHVPGYRYLYESRGTMTTQGSPAIKVRHHLVSLMGPTFLSPCLATSSSAV